LENFVTVAAVQEHANGRDLELKVEVTNATQHGGAKEFLYMPIKDGRERLNELRIHVQELLARPGSGHWGNWTDVKALSQRLKIGIFMFCDGLQDGNRQCLYNIGADLHPQDFPFWIALWNQADTHFRLAELAPFSAPPNTRSSTYSCFWSATEVPQVLLTEYSICNRNANRPDANATEV